MYYITTVWKLASYFWNQSNKFSLIHSYDTRKKITCRVTKNINENFFRTLSCCKFWIYWVGVNTKFTSCHVVLYCIYCHLINSKFITWQWNEIILKIKISQLPKCVYSCFTFFSDTCYHIASCSKSNLNAIYCIGSINEA